MEKYYNDLGGIFMKDIFRLKFDDFPRYVLLVSIITLSISLLFLANTEPVSHFEISIYSGIPFIFWILFTTSIVSSSIFLLLSSIYRVKHRYIYLSILVTFFAYFIFFLLPWFRGYLLFGRGLADILAHIGYSKYILQTGNIFVEDWYPVSHILMAQFEMFGLSFELSRVFICYSFTILFIIFSYLLIRELKKGYGYKCLPVLFCAIPLVFREFHLIFYPSVMSLILIPFFLYLFEKGQNKEGGYPFKICMLFLAFAIVFLHPVTTLFLILILIVTYFSQIISNRINIKGVIDRKAFLRFTLSILTISFMIWFVQFKKFFKNVSNAFISIFGMPEDVSSFEVQVGSIGESGLTHIQLIIKFINFFGVALIYIGVAFLIFFMILREFNSNRPTSYPKIWMINQYVLGWVTAGILVFFPLISASPIRNSRLAILMAVIMIGFYLNDKLEMKDGDKRRKKNLSKLTISIIILILISLILSIFTVYIPGNHLTYSEEEGHSWYLENADLNESVRYFGMNYKTEYYMWGIDSMSRTGGVFPDVNNSTFIPRHLGYDRNETIAETFENCTYIITKEYDYNYYKIFYPNQLGYKDYYTIKDLEKLEEDTGANKIYSNGGYILWTVN